MTRFPAPKTVLIAGTALALAGCQTAGVSAGTKTGLSGEPMGVAGVPYSGVTPTADNQAVIDALKAMNLRPYHTLTAAEARQQPLFGDGVKAVMRARGMSVAPPADVTERDVTVQGAAGPLTAKLYTPAGAAGPLPLIVYFHGGGWVIASADAYAASTRALAKQVGAAVLSVNYRLAPEAKFPAQHQDALAAYRWALANARSLGADANRVALAGESAGGNLSVATAVAARDAGVPLPRAILSVYPIAGSDLNTKSYQENAQAFVLNRAAMAWFLYNTMATAADAKDPRINLIAADLRGLPPVTLVQAEIDPLRTEGDLLADRLRAAGVTVNQRLYPRVTHEFFGAAAVIDEAKQAQAFASQNLRQALTR